MSPAPPPPLLELPLLTPSLRLRRFTLDDAPRLYTLSREAALGVWLPDQVYADEDEARRVAAFLIAQCERPEAPRGAPLVLGVARRDDDFLLGHVGLSPLRGEVEVGYAMAEASSGRGLATEAVRAVVEWALRACALPHVLGIVAAENAPSCRVLEKTGFVLVGEETRPLHGIERRVRTYRRSA